MSVIALPQRGATPSALVPALSNKLDESPAPLDSVTLDTIQALGEAHFWPHARKAGDLAASGIRVALRGRGVWVYDAEGRAFFDTLSGMWLTNIGHGRREIADAVYEQMLEIGYSPEGTVSPPTIQLAAVSPPWRPTPSRVCSSSAAARKVSKPR